MKRARAVLSALLALTGCDPVTRLSATLDAEPSATSALAKWCAARGLANPARITAAPVVGESREPPEGGAELLALPLGEIPGYRHVQLFCGKAMLSQAHNWYVRSRLTAEMNTALDTTNTPFGTVAAALHFTRQPLTSARGAAEGCPAETILSHRALLRLPGGEPLALVVECYTAANIAG